MVVSTSFIAKQIQEFFNAADKARRKDYTNLSGKDFYECPGAYSDEMNRAVARDMMQFYLFAGQRDEELKRITQSWMPKFSTLNNEVMRAVDDIKGDRPVKAINQKLFDNFIRDIDRASEIIVEKGIEMHFDVDEVELLAFWKSRVQYMSDFYYTLRQRHKIPYEKLEAQTREYDADETEMLNGLTHGDEKLVLTLCDLRKALLVPYAKLSGTPKGQKLRELLNELESDTNELINQKVTFGPIEPVEDPDSLNIFEDKAATMENDSDQLSDVIAAIKAVVNKIGGEPNSLSDSITLAKVLLSRLQYNLNTEGYVVKAAEGITKILRELADDIEMEAVLS